MKAAFFTAFFEFLRADGEHTGDVAGRPWVFLTVAVQDSGELQLPHIDWVVYLFSRRTAEKPSADS